MIYKFEDFKLNTDLQELFHAGVAIRMQPQVYALLELLISNHNRVVTKDEINAIVWRGRIVSEAVVNSRIRSVRQAVNDNGKLQRLVKTVHNRGFRFAIPPTISSSEPNRRPGDTAIDPVMNNSGPAPVNQPTGLHEPATAPLHHGASSAILSSIAILPFQNLSDDPEHHYFTEGICEDIITALTKVPRLFVVGRVPRIEHASNLSDVKVLGERLNVQHVLDGSVRCSDGRFRVSVQLIDAVNGNHVWAERYDREMQSIFDLQDDMAREIITALQVQLADGEDARLWADGTKSYQAWEAVLKARELCLTHRQPSVVQGRKFAVEAARLDPNYAGAWSWIGYSYWAEALGGWSDNPVLTLVEARKAAERGLAINPSNAGTLGLLALIMVSLRDFEAASKLANRAIEFGPNNNYAIGCAGAIKMYCNELPTAEALLRKAMRLAPLYKAGNPEILAAILMLLRRYDDAIAAARECLVLDPDYFFAYCTLAIIYAELDREEDALDAGRHILRINPQYNVRKFAMYQPFQEEGVLQRCLSGLRKAGIPES
ncbi:winged helix-turn-helix domain-containing protein [Parasphingorhabdus sp.]|uniref:winged helix-turn-helix domain-containing tetratricopeptide repeat protein n=1 Tax=Parasphingorhabdus sp. TaxID=2709688 RepID=UPI0032631F0A